MATLETTVGTVTAFDSPRGLGEITSADGTVFVFHCTQIADDTREIEVGRKVTFVVAAGGLGRWEATHIEKR